MHSFLERIKALGVPSVSNIGPSVSYIDHDSNIYKVLRKCGVTFENEIEMLKLAQGDARHGDDRRGVHRGGQPADGRDGPARPVLLPRRHDQGRPPGLRLGRDDRGDGRAYRRKSTGSCKRSCPRCILIAHGAAMETPEEAQYMLDHAACDGIWTGTSTERLPIERAVSKQARTFAALRFSKRRPHAQVSRRSLDARYQRPRDRVPSRAAEGAGQPRALVDMGVVGKPTARADVTREEVAEAGGTPLTAL